MFSGHAMVYLTISSRLALKVVTSFSLFGPVLMWILGV